MVFAVKVFAVLASSDICVCFAIIHPPRLLYVHNRFLLLLFWLRDAPNGSTCVPKSNEPYICGKVLSSATAPIELAVHYRGPTEHLIQWLHDGGVIPHQFNQGPHTSGSVPRRHL